MVLYHLIESQQLTSEVLAELFALANAIRLNPKAYSKVLDGKVVATVFYEPSTRTRLSFEAAVLRLGGAVISTENAREFSSAVKGESMEDSARIIASYADCIVLRHHEEGMAIRASTISRVPLINAGDGRGQHPTQALLDLYTIQREFNRIDNLTILMVGDLKNGRTVRSLCYLLAKASKHTNIIFVSPQHLRIGDDIKDYLRKRGVQFSEEHDLDKVISRADVIYMTRIQKERMSDEAYAQAKGKYTIDVNRLKLIGAGSRIMHPLPHVEEINLPFDVEQNDIRIAYFRQAENGLFIRMALLAHILSHGRSS